jgi:hypothetical protein
VIALACRVLKTAEPGESAITPANPTAQPRSSCLTGACYQNHTSTQALCHSAEWEQALVCGLLTCAASLRSMLHALRSGTAKLTEHLATLQPEVFAGTTWQLWLVWRMHLVVFPITAAPCAQDCGIDWFWLVMFQPTAACSASGALHSGTDRCQLPI